MTDTKQDDSNNKATGKRTVQVRASKRSIEYRKVNHRVRRSHKPENHRHEKDTTTNRSTVQECHENENRAIPIAKPVVTNQSEHKRPRSGVEILSVENLEAEYGSAPSECCDNKDNLPAVYQPIHPDPSGNQTQFVCKPSLVDEKRLKQLISLEMDYHPNNAFLYYVNPEVEDKVDAAQRNEAVHNLRFMHNAFFNLPTETFCKAVNLIDRFIVKVKVKPKYMACVATASYCAAGKLCHSNNTDVELPAPETLVQITRCGGNAADLSRMEKILASKLCDNLDGVNAYDFLRLFIDCIVDADEQPHSDKKEEDVDADEEHEDSTKTVSDEGNADAGVLTKHDKANTRLNQLCKRLTTRMEIALCYLDVYRFRPACLALGILAQSEVHGLVPLANLCGVSWIDVYNCAELVDRLYKMYYRDPVPRNRRQMVWTLSRRTLLRIGYSSPTPLDTISEVYEPAEEDEWMLPLLFEP